MTTPKKRYWYDCEFMEDGATIDLISIGMVCEDGRELYLQRFDANFRMANKFVRTHVFPHLTGFTQLDGDPFEFSLDPLHWYSANYIRDEIYDFVVDGGTKPEFWGYYSAYDHVALCQIFGTMMDLPKGWPYFTRDIQQEAKRIGAGEWPESLREGLTGHNALDDARWTRRAHLWLENLVQNAF